MDDQAAFKIIFAAGFSTIDKVTDLSGRGVGTDVVRLAVEALRGVIHIKSELGKGTSLRIELPASLLVSKGILVAVSGKEVVLPTETIRTMVKIPLAPLRTVHGQQIAPVRGAVVPVISLARALSFNRMEEKEKRTELATAIIEAVSSPYGLVVDHFLGEVEVVVKPGTGCRQRCPNMWAQQLWETAERYLWQIQTGCSHSNSTPPRQCRRESSPSTGPASPAVYLQSPNETNHECVCR